VWFPSKIACFHTQSRCNPNKKVTGTYHKGYNTAFYVNFFLKLNCKVNLWTNYIIVYLHQGIGITSQECVEHLCWLSIFCENQEFVGNIFLKKVTWCWYFFYRLFVQLCTENSDNVRVYCILISHDWYTPLCICVDFIIIFGFYCSVVPELRHHENSNKYENKDGDCKKERKKKRKYNLEASQ